MRIRMIAALIPALLMPALLAGCNGMQAFGGAPSQLAPIHYEYVYAMATFSQQVNISADGQMDVVQVKGSGPNDRRVAHTPITPEQKAALLNAFRGWKDLKHFYPAYFGPILSISFDGYKVEASDNENAPSELKNAKAVLDKIAFSAFPAPRPATQPAASGAVPAAQ